MPKLKQPLRLYDTCLRHIADNIDTYWLKKTNIKSLINLKIKSPFDGILNDEAIQFILEYLKKNEKLSPNHLYLLLNKNLKNLNLGIIQSDLIKNDSNLIKFIGTTCNKVIRLDLGYQCQLKPPDLINLLTPMRSLKSLNLSSTNANNEVFEAIMGNCMDLEELILQSCYSLNECCFSKLCNKLSKTLKILNIEYKKFKNEIIMEIFNKCKSLKRLKSYPNNLLFKVMYENNYKITDELSLDEVEIEYNDSKLLPDNVNAIAVEIANKCPMVKILYLKIYLTNNENFSYLKNFRNLQELHVNNKQKFSKSFKDYFKLNGNQLKVLELNGLDGFNLKWLLKYCSNLQKLKIYFSYCYNSSNELSNDDHDDNGDETISTANNVFECLIDLSLYHLDSRTQECLKEDFFFLLKKCVHLKFLDLRFVLHMNTDYFKKIILSLSKTVESINLHSDYCNSLVEFKMSDKFIMDTLILDDFNKLSRLLVSMNLSSSSECENKKREYLKLKELIKLNNYNLDLEFKF